LNPYLSSIDISGANVLYIVLSSLSLDSSMAIRNTLKTGRYNGRINDSSSLSLSVGTVCRHEKVGRIVLVSGCLREGSMYNVGTSLYRLAAGRWD
jgi:hypothetical protein